MTVYLDRIGAETAPARRTWSARDCALYALGVGAGFAQRAYTLDTLEDQKVYPTFALTVMAAEAESWPDPTMATGSFDLHKVLLGRQSLALHRGLDRSGDVQCVSRVAAIEDKGSGALILLEVGAHDSATNEPVFTASAGLFIVGEGGFGGDRGTSSSAWEVPGRRPDHLVVYELSATQSLLYRHAGNDVNPVHVDVDFAREAGFDGPILTGQNVLGLACRAIVETMILDEPERLRSIEGRFVASAYNGDRLTTELWVDPRDGVDAVRFRVRSSRGELIVDQGMAVVVSSDVGPGT